MSTTNDALQRAIDYIHATEVAPGRYAWHDAERGCYRVTDEEMMEALGWGLLDHIAPHETVRMNWENQEMGVEMGEWWKPENRIRYCEEAWCDDTGVNCEGHTVDLNTGEEIPA